MPQRVPLASGSSPDSLFDFSPPGALYLLLLKTTKRIVFADFAHLELYPSGQAVLFS
jgi:hypothetical protein